MSAKRRTVGQIVAAILLIGLGAACSPGGSDRSESLVAKLEMKTPPANPDSR